MGHPSIGVILFAVGFALIHVLIQLPELDRPLALIIGLYLAGGLLVGALFAWSLPLTRLRRRDIIVVSWLVLFIIQMFNNLLEAYFFTTLFTPFTFATATLGALPITFGESLLAGLIFASPTHDRNLFSELSDFFKTKAKASWVWRLALASAAYFPIYFVFGALVSPFILPYYADSNLGLTIPSFTTIIPLELFRGLLYVAAITPLLAIVKSSRKTLYLIIVLFLFVPGALVPLISEPSLPPQILPFHGVEILADSLVYGAVITAVLSSKTISVAGP